MDAKRNRPIARHQDDVLGKIFVGFANVPIYGTPGGRLASTAAMLTAATVDYFLIWLMFLDEHGVHLLRWLYSAWPWTSENFRSIKSKGFGSALFYAPLPFIFWWRVGRRNISLIGAARALASDRMWSAALYLGLVFGGPVISMEGDSGSAVLFATALIFVFWLVKKKVPSF